MGQDKPLNLENKHNRLRSILKEVGSAVVAFSGGLDSSLLLKVAHEVLGNRVLALTAVSPIYPEWEIQDAKRVAKEIGVRHELFQAEVLGSEEFCLNSPERCYLCKRQLVQKMHEIAYREGFQQILLGATVSDMSDYRPGHKAAEEAGARNPLLEAEFTKEDVRELAKIYGLSVWKKPAVACLASRIPYGEPITEDKLDRIAKAEQVLRQLGISQLRVRIHGDIARLEVTTDNFPLVIQYRQQISRELKNLGFLYVALDLEGYRAGSMNETLDKEQETSWFGESPGVPPQETFSRVTPENIEDVELDKISGWKPIDPGPDKYVVYLDGCSKGNPGNAAYAHIIFATGNLEMMRGGEYAGMKTNNQAEYAGLVSAMQQCLDLGFAKVLFLTDSELLVKQMKGLYRVKSPNLRPLWGQAKKMSTRFENFEIRHIPRTKNKAADKLANFVLKKYLKDKKKGSTTS